MAAAVAGGGRRGGVRDRAGPDVQGGDVRVHHQGEVRGLAQAGVHCRQEKGQAVLGLQPGGEMDQLEDALTDSDYVPGDEVHDDDRLQQGTHRAVCPCWMWLQRGEMSSYNLKT